MRTLQQLIRKNILSLKPYSCARDEYKGEASAYLDANENPYHNPYNRYPDPLQINLKTKIAELKNTNIENIMLGVGSDEPIDLIYRIFCEPTVDNAVAIDPSYGMYEVCANINNVEYRKVQLNNDFSLNADAVLKTCDNNTKLIFLCSPNNPTGNILNRQEIKKILDNFDGIIIIDEAYVDFSPEQSWIQEINKHDKLIVLQTFSKAWALASVRCGMAFANKEIIEYFNKVKYPYNINLLTQNFVSERLSCVAEKEQWVNILLKQRAKLLEQLKDINCVKHIYPTDSNFILVKVTDADNIYNKLTEKGIIVRNRNKVTLCENCLRITVGTEQENQALISELKQL